jgi:hypothetical protein
MLLEFVQHLLDWNARYLGIVGWLAILCLLLTFYAVFAIVKSPDMRPFDPILFSGRIKTMSRKRTMKFDVLRKCRFKSNSWRKRVFRSFEQHS